MCADNKRGFKYDTEAADCIYTVVGELSHKVEAEQATDSGHMRCENAGMSSERDVRNVSAVSLRVPGQG